MFFIENENNFKLLQSAIKWLSKDKKFHICIHDLSGVLHGSAALSLPARDMMHSVGYCDLVKTSPRGMRYCLKCKSLSIRKALKLRRLFIGQCYMGLTEIIKPVLFHDKPICIIYINNFFLQEKREQMLGRIAKNSSNTGVKRDKLINMLEASQLISGATLDEYAELAEILSNIILNSLSDTTRLKNKSLSASPVYTSSSHWVIEAMENYVNSYYNREIKLSQLANLYFLNPQYLCRLFKNKTGTNFSSYVNKVRIDHARRLLSATGDDITDISMQVGFNNVTYFNRLFKKLVGATPGEYRRVNSWNQYFSV